MSHAHKKTSAYSHRHIPSDPIKYVKQLENVGFTRAQAEMQSETFCSIRRDFQAMRRDFQALEEAIRRDLQAMRRDFQVSEEAMRRDFKTSEEAMRRDIKELENKTTTQSELLRRDLKIWLGSMLAAMVALFSAIVTLVPGLASG